MRLYFVTACALSKATRPSVAGAAASAIVAKADAIGVHHETPDVRRFTDEASSLQAEGHEKGCLTLSHVVSGKVNGGVHAVPLVE